MYDGQEGYDVIDRQLRSQSSNLSINPSFELTFCITVRYYSSPFTCFAPLTTVYGSVPHRIHAVRRAPLLKPTGTGTGMVRSGGV